MHGWQSEPTDGPKGDLGSESLSLYFYLDFSLYLYLYFSLYLSLYLSLSLSPSSFSLCPSLAVSLYLLYVVFTSFVWFFVGLFGWLVGFACWFSLFCFDFFGGMASSSTEYDGITKSSYIGLQPGTITVDVSSASFLNKFYTGNMMAWSCERNLNEPTSFAASVQSMQVHASARYPRTKITQTECFKSHVSCCWRSGFEFDCGNDFCCGVCEKHLHTKRYIMSAVCITLPPLCRRKRSKSSWNLSAQIVSTRVCEVWRSAPTS